MFPKSMISFLQEKKEFFFYFLANTLFFLLALYLFSLPILLFIYMLSLSFASLLVILFFSYRNWKRLEEEKSLWIREGDYSKRSVPGFLRRDSLALAMVRLDQEMKDQGDREERRFQEQKSYFTIWTHQIKSPLFALRLLLKDPDFHPSQGAKELFEIEEYVDMILAYIRLGSDSTDYVFSREDLDSLIKTSIRKYSFLCIGRKNRLDFKDTHSTILTDSKWFSFIFEQILSNAIKYTSLGLISIYREGNRLCVEDTGIGIQPEDLPRIFDLGYTGYNGRLGNKSTGLGLNLVQSIGENLNISFEVKSELGQGTCVSLDLKNLL